MKTGLLTGLARGWFLVYKNAEYNKALCLKSRKQGHFGILVDDDPWALKYQINTYRAHRASFSLTGQQMLYYGYPNISKEAAEKAALEETLRVFIREPRKKALRAIKILRGE